MAEKNLGDEIDKIENGIENLKNKEFKLFGIKATPTTITAALSGIGIIVGGLYTGFVMYQKVESIANLDVEAFEQRMEVIETKLDEAVSYTQDIKGDLKGDIRRIEEVVESVERSSKETMRDVNEDLRAFRLDMKQLEKDVNEKIQESLDNPLNNLGDK